jgi:hypothetical protein
LEQTHIHAFTHDDEKISNNTNRRRGGHFRLKVRQFGTEHQRHANTRAYGAAKKPICIHSLQLAYPPNNSGRRPMRSIRNNDTITPSPILTMINRPSNTTLPVWEMPNCDKNVWVYEVGWTYRLIYAITVCRADSFTAETLRTRSQHAHDK